MSRSGRAVGLGVISLIGGFLLAPFDSDAAPPARPEMIAVNVSGVGQRVASAPDRLVRTVDLLSMSGEKMGTATRDFAFTGPNTGDDVMTFHFPDGDLVSRAVLRFAAASSDPGFFFVTTRPGGNTVVPDRGTGAYAGRTGRVRMSGWHDGREFPERAGFDDFFVIELDPKA
jgi:hypothetical protein